MRRHICLTKRTAWGGLGAPLVLGVGSWGGCIICTHFRLLVKGFSCVLHPAGFCPASWAAEAACHLTPMGHPSPISSSTRSLKLAGRKCFIYVWTTTLAPAKFYLNMRLGVGVAGRYRQQRAAICSGVSAPFLAFQSDMCDFGFDWVVRSQIRKIDFPIDTFYLFQQYVC